jgi:hypothetical protein
MNVNTRIDEPRAPVVEAASGEVPSIKEAAEHFSPEESLTFEDIWGARITNVLQVVKDFGEGKGDFRTHGNSAGRGKQEQHRQRHGKTKRGRRNTEKNGTDNKTKHLYDRSYDTISTAAETPHGSSLLNSVEVKRVSRQSSAAEDHSNISFVSPNDITAVKSLHPTTQTIGDTSVHQVTFQNHVTIEEENDHGDCTHLEPLKDDVPESKITWPQNEETSSPKDKRKSRTRRLPENAEHVQSSHSKIRQRSLVFDEDALAINRGGLNDTNQTSIPDVPLLQQIQIQDRLWSSYSSIYDSDDDDNIIFVKHDGLHHLSEQSSERINASMIDFSRLLDSSFKDLFPDHDINDDDSSSSYVSSSLSEQANALDDENVAQQLSDKGESAATSTESVDLGKMDTILLDHGEENTMSDEKGSPKRLPRPEIFVTSSKGASALHRMKTRIRSRRRRQIAILRTAAVHKKALLEAKEAEASYKEVSAPSEVLGLSKGQIPDWETVVDQDEDNKYDVLTERVSLSSLANEVQDAEPDADYQGLTALDAKLQGSDGDDETVRISNQRQTLGRHGRGKGNDETQRLYRLLDAELPLVSNLKAALTVRRSRQRVRSQSPILHRLPPRANTPSPTRTTRKSHQKTSFGKYFPMTKSCPSSPIAEECKGGKRTLRVQFIGLSRPPNSGPMTSDRWSLVQEDSKKDVKSSGNVVSGDMKAPQRRKSFDGLDENGLQDSMNISRSSASSSHEAPIIPKRKDSLESLRIDEKTEYFGDSFDNPAVNPRRKTLEDIIEQGIKEPNPKRRIDPLLASALVDLSKQSAIAVGNDSRAEPVLETKQSSGEDSKESSNELNGSSLVSRAPSRVDSLGSDSFDLIPYRPPIPEAAEVLYASTISSASVPSDIGFWSDHDSISTYHRSTADPTMSNSMPFWLESNTSSGFTNAVTAKISTPSQQTFLGVLDRYMHATTKKDHHGGTSAKSKASFESHNGNCLPPSGRSGRASGADTVNGFTGKPTSTQRASSVSSTTSGLCGASSEWSRQKRSRSHDRNTESSTTSRAKAHLSKEHKPRLHDKTKTDTSTHSKSLKPNRSQSMSPNARTSVKPRESSKDRRQRQQEHDKACVRSSIPLCTSHGCGSPATRPKGSSSKSKGAMTCLAKSPNKSKSPSRLHVPSSEDGRSRRSGSKSHSPSRSSRSRPSGVAMSRKAKRPENESLSSPKISRYDVAAALSRSSNSRKQSPASCPQSTPGQSKKVRDRLANMADPLPLET